MRCALVGEVSAAQDTLSLLLPPTSRVEPSFVLVLLPPGSYASLRLLLMPKSLGPHVAVVVAVTAAVVDNVGDLTVIACWLAINAGIGVVVINVGDLRFQTHHRVRVIITYAGDVGFFWCSTAIRVGFGGLGCVRQWGGD